MKIPQNPTEEAQQLGFPSALFGFTPEQKEYWQEPGLPWLTKEIWDNPPTGRLGHPLSRTVCDLGGDNMAPRFPKGCRVNIAPVGDKQNLVVGKVYAYLYTDAETGEAAAQTGRLDSIGGNCLWARADNNNQVGLCWLLREKAGEETRDVYEVTHYVSYPAL